MITNDARSLKVFVVIVEISLKRRSKKDNVLLKIVNKK